MGLGWDCCISYLPSPNKGFLKGWWAAEGHPPPFEEAAEGRLLYIGAGEAANAGSMGVGEAADAAKA